MSARAAIRRCAGVFGVLAVFAVAACDDVIEPGGLGTFDLVEANGQQLPAVIFDGETEFGHVVATALSGSITLRESTYTERIVVDLVQDGQPLGDAPVIVRGDYTIDGQILSFDPEPVAYPGFSGILSEDNSTLSTNEVDPEFGELSLVWVR